MDASAPSALNLEFARKQAKSLLRALRSADPAALLRLSAQHPKGAELAMFPLGITLADAQLLVARKHGFASWTKLKRHIADSAPLTEVADQFSAAAAGHQADHARELLAAHPGIPQHAAYLAALCGDAAALHAHIAADAEAAVRPAGMGGLAPLTWLAFGCLHEDDPTRAAGIVDCARLLLTHGADPNGYFEDPDWEGSHQTCLYGATGHGNFPALAQLLLEAGADPNDDESLYHSAQYMYEDCLALLLKHGADVSRKSPHWQNTPLYFLLGHRETDRGVETADRGIAWLLEQGADPNVRCEQFEQTALHQAVELGRGATIIELLLKHGADPSIRRADGKTAYALAQRSGNLSAAAALEAAGASAAELSLLDIACSACAAGDAAELARLLSLHPELPAALGVAEQELLVTFGNLANAAGARLLLQLGADPAYLRPHGGTALHAAAFLGARETASALLADPRTPVNAVEPQYKATPLQWALYASEQFPSARGDYAGTVLVLLEAGATVAAGAQGSSEVNAVLQQWRARS